GAISKLANIADGLNGIMLTNKHYNRINKIWDWQKLLFEFFYSKNQAGYPWSRSTKSGDENYYNNYVYSEGWSYKSRGIGSPLIVPAHDAKEGQVSDPKRYFISNRVVAAHVGIRGKVHNWEVNSKLTFSKHYGTFATSQHGSSLGDVFTPPTHGIFTPVSQFSTHLAGERELQNNFFFGIRVALDQGELFDNSIGGQISLRKSFGRR